MGDEKISTPDDYPQQYAKAFDRPLSDEDAFRASIAAKEDDSLPSLVYADWLEEHGKPAMAEVLRRHSDEQKKGPWAGNYIHQMFHTPANRELAFLNAYGRHSGGPTDHKHDRVLTLTLRHPVDAPHTARWMFYELPTTEEEGTQMLHRLRDEGVRVPHLERGGE